MVLSAAKTLHALSVGAAGRIDVLRDRRRADEADRLDACGRRRPRSPAAAPSSSSLRSAGLDVFENAKARYRAVAHKAQALIDPDWLQARLGGRLHRRAHVASNEHATSPNPGHSSLRHVVGKLGQPNGRRCIRRSAPITTRRQCAARGNLRSIRQRRPFELVGEETSQENRKPKANFIEAIGPLRCCRNVGWPYSPFNVTPRVPCEESNLRGFEAVSCQVIKVEILQGIRTDGLFARLNRSAGAGRNELRRNLRGDDRAQNAARLLAHLS